MSEAALRRILRKRVPPLTPTQVEEIVAEYSPSLEKFEKKIRSEYTEPAKPIKKSKSSRK